MKSIQTGHGKILIAPPIGERSFSHSCRYGTRFECSRCDFAAPIRVINPPDSPAEQAADVAEMIGYHAAAIHPDLNGFAGYDTLQFVRV